ncbi:MAG: ABC transporter substrate-binding protein, partial [Deltaproteobacteria bacterium]|nr:ABC transporter substrate-binding protein [Deltaproteobacteria bacterium]
MKRKSLIWGIVIVAVVVIAAISIYYITKPPPVVVRPITIGVPLSTAFLYGWDAERGMRLAIEEINAKGGVNVGGVKRPFKIAVIDTRDLEPGVPVTEALLVVEKLILENKADFIMGGPIRSEAG